MNTNELVPSFETTNRTVRPSAVEYGCGNMSELDLGCYTQLKPYVLRLVHISRVSYPIDAFFLFDPFAILPFQPFTVSEHRRPAPSAYIVTGHGGFTVYNFPPRKQTNK